MTSLAVVTILLTAALGGEDAQRRGIALSFARLEADLALASRLDRMRAGVVALEPGERSVPLGRIGQVRETVRRLDEGLFEVRLALDDPSTGVRSALTTQIAQEAGR